jgi:hypothetical protein
VEFGDPEDDDEDGTSELSVVLEDPEATDKRKIAAVLIKTYEAASGKFMGFWEQWNDQSG